MRILCDENVRHAIFHLLVQEGYDVERVQDRPDIGDGDDVVIEYCRERGRVSSSPTTTTSSRTMTITAFSS